MSSLSTLQLLTDLEAMIQDVTSTNSSNDKISKLSSYPQLQPFLRTLMDPLETTGVTRKLIEKHGQKKRKASSKPNKPTKKRKTNKGATVVETKNDSGNTFTSDLMDMVCKLQSRDYSGHAAYDAVLHMIAQYPEHEDLILNVADGDLKIRMGVTQVNKAFPNLITEFSAALAKKFEDHEKKFREALKQNITWFISRKYDGVRCLTVCLPGDGTKGPSVKCYSREGRYFPAMANLENLLKPFVTKPMVLDGEVCVIDEKTGEENFKAAVSAIKRKSVIMKNFKYCVFDLIDKKDFDAKKSKKKFSERQVELKHFLDAVNSPHIYQATQTRYDEEVFAQMSSHAESQGWEGLMLRKDIHYEGKRTNSILKCKKFEREEYVVIATENKVMRFIDDDTGLEKAIDTLGSVSIEHKGNVVKVGSGFSKEERERFFKDPSLIIGKTISVQYFEETPPDDEGLVSLRFPTFKCIYGESRDM